MMLRSLLTGIRVVGKKKRRRKNIEFVILDVSLSLFRREAQSLSPWTLLWWLLCRFFLLRREKFNSQSLLCHFVEEIEKEFAPLQFVTYKVTKNEFTSSLSSDVKAQETGLNQTGIKKTSSGLHLQLNDVFLRLFLVSLSTWFWSLQQRRGWRENSFHPWKDKPVVDNNNNNLICTLLYESIDQ